MPIQKLCSHYRKLTIFIGRVWLQNSLCRRLHKLINIYIYIYISYIYIKNFAENDKRYTIPTQKLFAKIWGFIDVKLFIWEKTNSIEYKHMLNNRWWGLLHYIRHIRLTSYLPKMQIGWHSYPDGIHHSRCWLYATRWALGVLHEVIHVLCRIISRMSRLKW